MEKVLLLLLMVFAMQFVLAANQIDESIPAELFDIRMMLDDNYLQSSDEISAVITYESFGRISTPVDLLYTIYSIDGTMVYMEEENIIVRLKKLGENLSKV